MSEQHQDNNQVSAPLDSEVTSTFFAVERHLKSYLTRFFIRPQDIEDTVQETFLRAYESEQKTNIHSPKSFLFKIAKNLALSELSRKCNSMTVAIDDMDDTEVLEEGKTLVDDLQVNQMLNSLAGVIGALPPKCQKVIVMRKVYGFSHKEIAKRLDISVKTVERHLTKALERCQNSLASNAGKAPQKTLRSSSGPRVSGGSEVLADISICRALRHK
ncbi:MAG: RNA polymerase sigma factor [Pseudomonadales bacterium]|nr:RNA polymerase sigma factor [Pseudomonadales bacterium]